MRCPVWCTAQQEYCYVDSYDAKGNWLSVEETCVNPGETCDCTKGQNAFSCTMTDGVSTWSECLPINGGYCPPSCAANEVPCFEVENFRPNGTSIGFTEPPKPCAADYESCSCGREAKNCGGWCIFKEDNCPVFCEVGKKKCFIDDYDTSGNYLGDREVCVAEDQVCPCGKNTLRCPGDDMCLRKSEADLVCPCSESQKQCTVRDYTARGKLESVSTLCVNLGNKCPCGKNTLSCSDPNDPDDNICNPKYAGTVLNKCPKPCTPTEEAAGNKTCIQTHLTNTGTFESETISCLPAASCTPGRNMKKCTSGSTIPAWKPCKDFYNTAKSNSSAVGAGKKESSQVLSNGALGSSEDVRVMMNAEVYLPTGCESSLDIKTSKSNRRLKGRKLQTTGGAVLKFTVSNQGATSVSPTAVAEQLKQQVKRQSPGMKTALTQLGTVDEKAAVAMSSQTTTVRTRAAAVQEKNLAALGVTTTTTTTTTQSTTTGATTAAPATTTTAAGPTTTTMGATTVADSTTERTISSATCRHFALLPLLAAYLSFAR
ncbi:unnamed protein product [Effrenium voratum]|nr:unnamed protein product [Effrenium voratum]